MEDNRRQQRSGTKGPQLPPTKKGEKTHHSKDSALNLKMPGSNVTVDSQVRQRQAEEERRTRMEIERKRREKEEQKLKTGQERYQKAEHGQENKNAGYERENKSMKKGGTQVSKKEQNHKRKIKRLWGILGAEIVFFSLLLIGYAVFYANSKMDKLDYNDINIEDLSINDGLSDLTREKYTTIALFGLDARDITTDRGNHSDTIIIASVNNETKEVKLVSIYRDCYLEQENPYGNYDDTYTKITHAYAFGGPTGAIATINKNLDLQITEYVTVNFASLTDVIDDLGGITLNVDEAERQAVNHWIPETAEIAGMSYTNLEVTGDVTLDGLQAVTYARIRSVGNGDIERASRQREVLAAILEKMKHSDLKTLNQILDHVLPEVSTSLSKKEILGLMVNLLDYELTENEGFPFIYSTKNVYDPIIGAELSDVVPANLENNVLLLHEFLYDAEIQWEIGSEEGTDDLSEDDLNGQGDIGVSDTDTESLDEDIEYYTPSSEVHEISEYIQSFTGIYPPEDPEFRGGF